MLTRKYKNLLFTGVFVFALNINTEQIIKSGDYNISVDVITNDLHHPWSMAFLNNGNILATEREGRLRLMEIGHLNPRPISELPDII